MKPKQQVSEKKARVTILNNMHIDCKKTFTENYHEFITNQYVVTIYAGNKVLNSIKLTSET